MTGRDGCGRFAPGNPWASRGGRVRAAKLSPERRREIARMGWEALVSKRFHGDVEAAKRWLGDLGAWAADQAYRGTSIYKPDVFRHPGPCPGGD
jgi:hypothetical protein